MRAERQDGLSDDAGIAGYDPMDELVLLLFIFSNSTVFSRQPRGPALAPAAPIGAPRSAHAQGIPKDQRPVNELKELREATMYNWALLDPASLALRVALLWAFFFAFAGAPISNVTFDPARQPAEFALAASAGALVPVVAAMLRVYMGWAYVGNRLLSAVVEYEETGWYDGQIWVKPPKVLARDRLLGSYEVKPTLGRLKATLAAAAGLLAAASIGLVGLTEASNDENGMYGRGAGPAASASRAAGGSVPGYCADRYFRALAGGPVDCDAAISRARGGGPGEEDAAAEAEAEAEAEVAADLAAAGVSGGGLVAHMLTAPEL